MTYVADSPEPSRRRFRFKSWYVTAYVHSQGISETEPQSHPPPQLFVTSSPPCIELIFMLHVKPLRSEQPAHHARGSRAPPPFPPRVNTKVHVCYPYRCNSRHVCTALAIMLYFPHTERRSITPLSSLLLAYDRTRKREPRTALVAFTPPSRRKKKKRVGCPQQNCENCAPRGERVGMEPTQTPSGVPRKNRDRYR